LRVIEKDLSDYHYVSASEYGNVTKASNLSRLTGHPKFKGKNTAEKCIKNNELFQSVANQGFHWLKFDGNQKDLWENNSRPDTLSAGGTFFSIFV